MGVKTAFLNDFVEKEIYMDQPEGFTCTGEEQKVCCLQRAIYGLKQAFQNWSINFDEVIWGYNFTKNESNLVYTRRSVEAQFTFLVLYVDDILLIENNVKILGNIKAWLSTQFFMKNMYILGIKIYRDRPKRILKINPIFVH